MRLYHGGMSAVANPEIRLATRFLDFGNGFYTTTNVDQARVWANKIAEKNNSKSCYVSTYDFDYESALKTLKIKEFKGESIEWLNFVKDNRLGKSKERHDIVIGPVADDKVYQVIRLFELDAYSEDETLTRLKVEKLYDQILFSSTKALSFLTYISSEEILNG